MEKIIGLLEEIVCLAVATVFAYFIASGAPGLMPGMWESSVDLADAIVSLAPKSMYDLNKGAAALLLSFSLPAVVFYLEVYILYVRLPLTLSRLCLKTRWAAWLMKSPPPRAA